MPRGATTGPTLERPGNGFGRPLRPGPAPCSALVLPATPETFDRFVEALTAAATGRPAERA